MSIAIPKEWRLPAYAVGTIALVLGAGMVAGQINEAHNLDGFDFAAHENVAVMLDFEPERFHIEAFQEVGRYQGWKDDRAIIMSVDPDALKALARNYWIVAISPLEEQS